MLRKISLGHKYAEIKISINISESVIFRSGPRRLLYLTFAAPEGVRDALLQYYSLFHL